jgi:hypothetical protein
MNIISSSTISWLVISDSNTMTATTMMHSIDALPNAPGETAHKARYCTLTLRAVAARWAGDRLTTGDVSVPQASGGAPLIPRRAGCRALPASRLKTNSTLMKN